MQESWGGQRRKRIVTTNPAPVQPTEKETLLLRAVPASPMITSTMPKDVPAEMAPASPRRVNTVERELQEAENLRGTEKGKGQCPENEKSTCNV